MKEDDMKEQQSTGELPAMPIKNCYWVIPGRFLAGEYPGDREEHVARQKVGALINAGVTLFVDLTGPADRMVPYKQWCGAAAYFHSHVPDQSIPDSTEQTSKILDVIDAHLDNGGLVYLHCWGGVGRTGVIVGCWLARHGFSGQAALVRLHELWQSCPKSGWRRSPENVDQEDYVTSWVEPAKP